MKKSITIIPFRGFGTTKQLHVQGRIVYGDSLSWHTKRRGTIFHNIISMWRRYRAQPIVHAQVEIIFQGKKFLSQTNSNGVFEKVISLDTCVVGDEGWHAIAYRCSESTAEGQVYLDCIPDEFGVISDIDDTILISRASNIIATVWTLVTGNAHTRKLFPQTASLYQRLEKGSSGMAHNPFFYISSSHWQLYDFLERLFFIHKLPKGVFLLKEVSGIVEAFRRRRDHEHKYHAIVQIIEATEQLPFILIGDTAQMDPLVYVRIAEKYPKRVTRIYLRDVWANSNTTSKALQAAAQLDVSLVVVPHTKDILEHAKNHGLIV